VASFVDRLLCGGLPSDSVSEVLGPDVVDIRFDRYADFVFVLWRGCDDASAAFADIYPDIRIVCPTASTVDRSNLLFGAMARAQTDTDLAAEKSEGRKP